MFFIFIFVGELTSNSTSKITNLVFEWNLECKQELIKMFKNLSELCN